jgi:hypothetical protein
MLRKDTLVSSSIDSIKSIDTVLNQHLNTSDKTDQYRKIILENKFITNDKVPVAIYQKEREPVSNDLKFYVLASLFFFLGILRIIFGKYFTNLIRVFFNTSLRQSQLTDQLIHDKLPSLVFNLFFVLVCSMYIFLLLVNFKLIQPEVHIYFFYSILVLCIVYFVKFLSLHFIGWISGFRKDIEYYIFIVFLVNKILALFLLPLITIIAFSDESVKNTAIVISYFLIAFMFILRYLRGFSLIQHSLKVSKFHFLIYVIAVELLPIFLIYQFILTILNKS